MSKTKVCVIGAGAAGLCAGRHLQANDRFEFDIFEEKCNLGGVWLYEEKTGTDEFGLPIRSPMYQNCVMNLPMKIMEFPDFPADDSLPCFAHNTQCLDYLQAYVEKFNFGDRIKFRHQVLLVKRVDDDWQVTVKDLTTGNDVTQIYNAVIVGSGNCYMPFTPSEKDIKGLETFTGKKIHSCDYRLPDAYAGKNVVVVGGRASASDIALDICNVAANVHLVHYAPYSHIDLPSKITEIMGRIEMINESSVKLTNGQVISDVDAIIFGTGYKYYYPFLHENCGVKVNENNRVEGLFMQLINIQYPSMAVVGVPFGIPYFPFYDIQARVFMKTLTGEVELPLKAAMLEQERNDCKIRANRYLPEKAWHLTFGDLAYIYEQQLTKFGQMERMAMSKLKWITVAVPLLLTNQKYFKQSKLTLIGDNRFVFDTLC